LNNEEAKRQLIDSNIIYGIDLLSALSYCNNLKLFINTGSFTEYRKGYRQIEDTYLYSATKSAFRPILDYYANLGNYKYITAVPYSVYGGIPTAKRIMDYMMDAAVAETPVDMTAGEQVLDFIHVDDIVAFFVSIIEKYDSYLKLEQGHEFHLGTGRGYTLREVATELENISGRKLNINWGGRQYRDRDTMYAVAPISYNSDTNLWKSKISLHEGLCQFVNLSQCLISKNY
jgi:CDP-paratose synthetase